MHQVNLGWVTQIYNAAEALPNLLNPFWMLPLLGLLHVKARDLVGYMVLQVVPSHPGCLLFMLAVRPTLALRASDEIGLMIGAASSWRPVFFLTDGRGKILK